jgi:Phage P22-like portal protein
MAAIIQADEVRTAQSDDSTQRRMEQERVCKFIREALTRFKLAADNESKPRKDMRDDWKFAMGEQWGPDIQSQRVADGRPCLVMDHLKQSIRQVCNEQRQQRPSIQVNPVGDAATREVADVLQGLVRHIEVRSEAEVAYDSAFEHMIIGGLGWLRVLTDWTPGPSFEQEIKIQHVRNPFTVYSDPSAMMPDKSDAKWRFIVEDVPREEFKMLYPLAEAASLEDFTSIGDQASAWANKETVRVAEYFHIEEDIITIVKLQSGAIVEKSKMPPDAVPVDQRDYTQKKVVWSKIDAVEILEEQDWPGSIIPVIPVLGEDFDLDGVKYIAGLVRNAKDPQRMYNYQCSAATELSSLAPRAPFIGPKGFAKSSESQWRQINQKNFPYIEYDVVNGPGGAPLNPPERNVAEPPIQAAVALMQAAGNDLKASLGIYDASLGAPGPEQSGKAILARQKQGDIATLNFSDNLSRSMRVVGRILIEIIPKVFDVPKMQHIINPDQTVKAIGIFNSKNYSPDEAKQLIASDEAAIPQLFDIGAGKYDTTISVGPSYQSKRAEAQASVQALVESYPALMQYCGDLLVSNMDWPYAQEIAKRLKKTIPPNLLDQDGQSVEEQLQAAQAQVQQLTQQVQQDQQLLQQQHDIIAGKTVEAKGKLDAVKLKGLLELALQQLDRETQLAVAEVNTKAQSQIERDKVVSDVWQATHSAAHEIAAAQTQPAALNQAQPADPNQAQPPQGGTQ